MKLDHLHNVLILSITVSLGQCCLIQGVNHAIDDSYHYFSRISARISNIWSPDPEEPRRPTTQAPPPPSITVRTTTTRRTSSTSNNTETTRNTTTTTTTVSITTTSSSTSCICGVPSSRRNEIVGGQAADKNEYPWQVALVPIEGRIPFCGGAIISSDTILTAAHCKQDVSYFKIVVGEHDYLDDNDGQKIVSPAQWISHPLFDWKTGNDYDFAIIKLSTNLTWSNSVLPVCLPNTTANYDSVTAVVTGWGTSKYGQHSTVLHEAELVTRSNEECTTNTLYGKDDVSPQMICASGSGHESCQGDRGGPLISLENNQYFSLIGVVSWGYSCGRADAPSVFSRVTSQWSWITSKMSGTSCQNLNTAQGWNFP